MCTIVSNFFADDSFIEEISLVIPRLISTIYNKQICVFTSLYGKVREDATMLRLHVSFESPKHATVHPKSCNSCCKQFGTNI